MFYAKDFRASAAESLVREDISEPGRRESSGFGGYSKPQEADLSDIYFTSAPDQREAYKVGDAVEVYCDHENEKGVRVRDWLIGTVVQVDPKMIAVQFQENVYLTDGWMVPDHVLWCPKISANLRLAQNRRRKTRPTSNVK